MGVVVAILLAATANNLVASLAPGVVKERINIEDYGHMDFLWALNAPEVLYPQLLLAMRTFATQGSQASGAYVSV